LGQAVFHITDIVKMIPATCTKLYLKQTFNAMFIAVENPELRLVHFNFWWFIPSCIPSLIFRLNGQKSRNPLQIQPEGKYGQRAVTSSRGFGKPAVEGCVEVSDDFTEFVTPG
jgi:hypothetical protein